MLTTGKIAALVALAAGVTAAIPIAAGADGQPAVTDPEKVDFFEKKIRPVLVDHCYKCHGDKGKVKGGLRLDSALAIGRGGTSGPAVVPGDPDASLLVKGVRYTDADFQMPPKEKLPDAAIANIVAWVKMGAPLPAVAPATANGEAWRKHWAFTPPRRPPLPPASTAHAAWARNDVDRFIVAKLEEKGLGPSPTADRRTLIRRATFDLTGLPPTDREVAAFIADKSPAAYDHLVDRLLASPHYGERWGRHWLDVARYADTKGYVYSDREDPRFVHSFAYRDWVIGAMNRDLPYDQFIVQQLAAEQVSAPQDPSSLAALGFLTLGRRFINNPHDIIDDRIDVVTRGFLGLTVTCARCHDHKYDPIPTRDYYSLYGVFYGSSEKMVPLLPATRRLPDRVAFETELARRQDKLGKAMDSRKKDVLERLRDKVTDYLVAALDVEKLPTEETNMNLHKGDMNPFTARQWSNAIYRGKDGPIWKAWNAFAVLPAAEFSKRAPDVARRVGSDPELNPLVARAFADAPPASMRTVAERYGKVFTTVNDEWKKVSVTGGEKDRAAAPVTALPDPAAEALRQVLYGPASPLAIPTGRFSEAEWYFDDEPIRQELGSLQRLVDRWIIEAPGSQPHAVILEDKPAQVTPRVFRRGNAATQAEMVPRQFLGMLAGRERRPFEDGSGRLELARAIASPENPLTARVIVNRVWRWHFGTGFVSTPSDFGVRTEPPLHQALLDWLAVRFVEDGWSLKKLHRAIMLSATYQQSSDDDPTARKIDPVNARLWRMPRRRLDFEEMRDAALAVAGRLDPTVGGHPFPLIMQPAAPRRSIYGFIDRLNLPGMMRAFDFAGPDTHSPLRFFTTVPQQALFMMNGPFMTEQARFLAGRPEVRSEKDPGRRIDRMYRILYGRAPTAEEREVGLSLVRDVQHFAPPTGPPAGAWSYGCGSYDETGRLRHHEPLTYFTGTAWQSVADLTRAASNRCQITAEGGAPGTGPEHAVIRRWMVPADGQVSLTGAVTHKGGGTGDGIRARVVASGSGEIASFTVHSRAESAKADVKIEAIEVKKGEWIDFVVDGRRDSSGDEFQWAPVVTLKTKEPKPKGAKSEWDAKADFCGPTTTDPIGPWDKLAQVLLETNEFVFID